MSTCLSMLSSRLDKKRMKFIENQVSNSRMFINNV